MYEILCHPMYAGAYAYGRYPTVRGSAKGRRAAPPEEWVCLLRDKVPAYISWSVTAILSMRRSCGHAR